MYFSMSLTDISREEWQVIAALACALFGFLAYHFSTAYPSNRSERLISGLTDNTRIILLQRLKGALFLGALPLLFIFLIKIVDGAELGLGFGNFKKTLFWLGALGAPILAVNFFQSKKPLNQAMYPQMRLREWMPKLLLISGLSWALYLLAYEILFRGILLLPVAAVLGWPVAIVLNMAFYALAHLPKGLTETLAAIPFGLILCLITASTGSIWAAFFLHLVLALSNEWFSIYRHPEMSFVIKEGR